MAPIDETELVSAGAFSNVFARVRPYSMMEPEVLKPPPIAVAVHHGCQTLDRRVGAISRFLITSDRPAAAVRQLYYRRLRLGSMYKYDRWDLSATASRLRLTAQKIPSLIAWERILYASTPQETEGSAENEASNNAPC